MKLHHAAALALMVWYLLIPPWNVDSKGSPLFSSNPDAPLSQWTKEGTFDSPNACDQALHRLICCNGSEPLPDRLREYAAQCITSDDPRLNRN
jgi:hypothetical protein